MTTTATSWVSLARDEIDNTPQPFEMTEQQAVANLQQAEDRLHAAERFHASTGKVVADATAARDEAAAAVVAFRPKAEHDE
jgi:hypothetical protein